MGAIRRLDAQAAELRRMWLLEAYHGQGIGYRLLQELMAFARGQGYQRMVLMTGVVQERAICFYQRVGFVESSAIVPGDPMTTIL